jgi:hypothetical protein
MSTPEKTTTALQNGAAVGGPATAVLDAPVSGATDVVEARTTEAAIAEVHQRLGPDARILDARRVLRGGIGGFFAKEHVQLHVAPGALADRAHPGGGVASSADPAARTTAVGPEVAGPNAASVPPRVARPSGTNPWAQIVAGDANALSPVDRLLAEADEVPDDGPTAVDFATFLRDQLGPEVVGGPSSGPTVGSSSGPTVDASSGPTADASSGPTADDQLVRPAWPRIDVDSATLIGGTAVRLDADGEVVDLDRPAASAPVTTPEPAPAPGSASAEALLRSSAAPPVTPVASVAAPAPPAGAALRVTSAPDPLHGEPSPAQDGGPGWSVAALLALGLPVELIRSLEVASPGDDIAWTMALAEALRPSCRPLPDGPAVFVGPGAEGFAHVGDAPVARSETWLAALRPGRWIHLVVGGDDWRRNLAESPLAASWAEPDDLPDAIRCAVELGLVLGYGPIGAGIRRARPLDVALAVRDLVAAR